MNEIRKNQYFSSIQKRIEPFDQIENLLDSNQLVFRYNEKLQSFSIVSIVLCKLK